MVKIPKDFLDCVKNGGRVKTKKLKGDKYIRICYDKEGNSYAGEVMKTKKTSKSTKEQTEKSNLERNQIKESKDLAESLLKLKAYYDEQYHVK